MNRRTLVKPFQERLSMIVGIIIGVISLVSTLFYLDNRWAKSRKVKKLEVRLEVKIQHDRLDRVQDRSWKIEDRYANIPMPEDVKDDYRQLKIEIKRIESRIKHVTDKPE